MTYAAIDGHAVTSLRLHVPERGVWYAEADFVEQPDVEGAVTITIGDVELVGTVDPRATGTHGLQRRVRVIGGGGGWGTLLSPKSYHNDSGIRASAIAQDAAREAGEQLGDFTPERERVGVDYIRQTGPASRVLEDVIGSAAWWVGYDGVTRVGAREEAEADASAYQVLEHHARERVLTLAVDNFGAVGIGSILSEGLDEPQTVRELSVEVTSDSVRARAWTGGEAGARGRLAGALRGFIDRSTDGRLFGLWRYRVVQMSSERVELQAVRAGAGLPNALPISMWPGVAGAHSSLTLGAHVLVQFIEGDRTLPIVTHFAGKDGVGWSPVVLTLDAETIKLGDGAAEGAARGTSLKDWLDAHTHGYIDTSDAGSTPGLTSPPVSAYVTPPGVADPSPDPSSKVFVQ